MKLLKSAKWIYSAVCVLFIGMGIFLVIKPEVSITTMSYVVGALMLAFGIIRIIGYFADDLYSLAFQFDLALGIFAVVVGIVFILHPEWLISALPVATGIFILINGLFSFQSSIDAKKFGIRGWWLLLCFALLTCAVGLVLIFNPARSALVVTEITGIAFILSGIEKLVVALSTIKTRKSKAEPVEVEFIEVSDREDDEK